MKGARFRTARGQLALLGATLGGALVLALVAVRGRSWFESHVRERLPAADSVSAGRLPGLTGPDGVALAAALTDAEAESVYAAWLADPSAAPADFAAVLTAGRPVWAVERARATLLAGSPAQRLSAAGFLGRCGRQEAAAPLRRARDRFARAGDPESADLCEKMLDFLSQTANIPANRR